MSLADELELALADADGGEINPSNYGHDDVCLLNDRYVAVFEVAERAIVALRQSSPPAVEGEIVDFAERASVEMQKLYADRGRLSRQLTIAQGEAEALRRMVTELEAAGTSVLGAMDRYNEKNGTFIGGAPFFRLGRIVGAARAFLTPDTEGAAE